MRKDSYPIPAVGTCAICKKPNQDLHRTYFHYDEIKCLCHSPNHFDLIDHCKNCEPKEPLSTMVNLSVEETNKSVTVPAAVMTLIEALESDPEYRVSWQANIAMAFQDAYAQYQNTVDEQHQVMSKTDIHAISNEAANNFLEILCLKPSKD